MLNDILLIENQKKLCPIVVQLLNEKKKEKNKGEKRDNETEKKC